MSTENNENLMDLIQFTSPIKQNNTINNETNSNNTNSNLFEKLVLTDSHNKNDLVLNNNTNLMDSSFTLSAFTNTNNTNPNTDRNNKENNTTHNNINNEDNVDENNLDVIDIENLTNEPEDFWYLHFYSIFFC